MEKSDAYAMMFESAVRVLRDAGFSDEIATCGAVAMAECAERHAAYEEVRLSVENMVMVAGLPVEEHSS